MNGDYLKQESTEDLTTDFIKKSQDVMDLFREDDIKIAEIERNESGEPELGFKTKSIARKFVQVTSKMSVIYRDDRTRFSMQFIADILKGLKESGKITVEELYDKKESDIIRIIESSKYKDT